MICFMVCENIQDWIAVSRGDVKCSVIVLNKVGEKPYKNAEQRSYEKAAVMESCMRTWGGLYDHSYHMACRPKYTWSFRTFVLALQILANQSKDHGRESQASACKLAQRLNKTNDAMRNSKVNVDDYKLQNVVASRR